MDIFSNQGNQEIKRKFFCQVCDYSTSYKSEFDRHCSTRKHLDCHFQQCPAIKNPKITFDCFNCERKFETNSGLWRHKQKCLANNNVLVDYLLKENKELKTTIQVKDQQIDKIIKSNEKLIESNEENVKHIVTELCKNAQSVTNNTMINSNNNNKTFNLQFFLNETCKDALNLSEFIQSIKVDVDDLNSMGSLGYVDGTSNVIIKHLEKLGVERRPIQCTDAKRQTLYIKENNEWTKEDPTCTKMHLLVDEVQQINLRQLPAWREKHPNCLTSNSVHTDFYNNMSQELMGGFCHKVKLHVKDNKIINKIIKEVTIDKQNYATIF